MTTPTTTTTAKKSTQSMIATSQAAYQFVEDEAASFSAPNKGGDITNATKRELVDAMHRFVEATRYVTHQRPVMAEETSEQGETILIETGEVEDFEVDAFGETIEAVLAERLTTQRANSGAAKIASLQDELAKLRAELAARS
jgi:hypothetical protein